MLAVLCRTPGRLLDLTVEELDDPHPHAHQVVIDVRASGVNYVDALFVQGTYQIKPQPPFVPGSEVAGLVAEIGSGVDQFAVGDRVLLSCGLGGFAQAVVAAADQLYALPDNLSFAAAACFTQSYCTAQYLLEQRVQLTADERVLVLGGGGGVGLATIQIARAMGATVIATGSTPEKRAAALVAGAQLAIDAEPRQLKEAVRAALPGGVDVVVDPVGGAASSEALRTLREGGRLAVVGFASGSIPNLPANHVLLRNRSVIGVDWGAWAMSHPDEQRTMVHRLLERVQLGELAPSEPTTYDLRDAVRALEDLLNRRVVGKVALVTRR